MEVCPRHRKPCTRFCLDCQDFLCASCEHTTIRQHMFISTENFKKAAEHVRSIAEAVSTTENNKVSDLKAMDMVLAHSEVREVL